MSDSRISAKPLSPAQSASVSPRVREGKAVGAARIQPAQVYGGRLAPLASQHPACIGFLKKQAEWEKDKSRENISALVRSLADLLADRDVPRGTRREFAVHLGEILQPLAREQRPGLEAMRDLFESAIPIWDALEGPVHTPGSSAWSSYPAWDRNFSAAIIAGNSHVLRHFIEVRMSEPGDKAWLDMIAASLDAAQSVCAPPLFSECMDVVCELITQPEDLVTALQVPAGKRTPLHERDRHCHAAYCEKVAHSRVLSEDPKKAEGLKGDLLACSRLLDTGSFYLRGRASAQVILAGLHAILRGAGQEKRDLEGLRWDSACRIAQRYIGAFNISVLVDELFMKDEDGERDQWVPPVARKAVEYADAANLRGADEAAKRLRKKSGDSKCVVS